MSRNLLPNGSFELDLSQPIHATWREMRVNTNWGDLQNRLTLLATALGQAPETAPESVAVGNAPDGARGAEIHLEATDAGASVGHLTSPVVEVTPQQVYTVSVYARSEEPSAQLQLGLWTTPVDFNRPADFLSYSLPLTSEWQRHSSVVIAQDMEDRAVVDLIAVADRPCRVWVDAVQLEEGPRATEFQTRYPVEAKLEGRQFPALVHLQNEPRKKYYLSTYNSTGADVDCPIEVQIFDMLSQKKVFTHTLRDSVPAGFRETELELDLPHVGEFFARVAAEDGTPIGLDDYVFAVHPVIEDDYQGVLRTHRGTVEHVDADRAWLPWQNEVNWYSDCRNNIIVTDAGVVHVMTSDNDTVMATSDGGRTWDTIKVTKTVNTILRSGDFLNFETTPDAIDVSLSSDDGKTWNVIGSAAMPENTQDMQKGPITELKNGTLIWPIGHRGRCVTEFSIVYAFRSADGGRTWSEGSPMCHGGEPAISELSDGRLIAVCRNNPRTPTHDWTRVFDNEKPWQLWQRFHGAATLTSYCKRTTLVESDDGGVTWGRPRPATLLMDEIRGQVIELPDGRLVLLNTHRVPTLRGGERARISSDGGKTWGEEIYHMNSAKAYPGYASSCVLPPHLGDGEPGMILTVVGERSESNWGSEGPPTSAGFEHMPRLVAIRWRP